MSGVKEECGVFGIYDLDGGNIAPSIYYGLTSLQHRGQEQMCIRDRVGEIARMKERGIGTKSTGTARKGELK